jgi:hypothetical protein
LFHRWLPANSWISHEKMLVICLLGVLLMSACASPTVVQAVKPGDTGLTCPQLQNEYVDAEKMKHEAAGAIGVTGGNNACCFGPQLWEPI